MGRRDPHRTLLPDLAIVVVFFGTLPQSICCSANVVCEFHDWRPSSSKRTSSLRSQPSPVAVPESKAHWRLSVDCVSSASERIAVRPLLPEASTKLSPIVYADANAACADDCTGTLGLRISQRSSRLSVVVTTHEQTAQSDHIVLLSTSMARRSATTAESEYWYTIDGERDTIAAQAQDVNPTLSLSVALWRGHRKPTEPGTGKTPSRRDPRAVDALWWI